MRMITMNATFTRCTCFLCSVLFKVANNNINIIELFRMESLLTFKLNQVHISLNHKKKYNEKYYPLSIA